MDNEPRWAQQYLSVINCKLDRIDAFLTFQYPEECKKTERRLTTLETRMYLVCASIVGGISYGPDIVHRLFGG